MTITTIVGDVGSGKTTLCTYLAVRDGRDIWSNYGIKVERYHDLDPEQIEDLYDCVICGDELWSWLDCRVSGAKLNEYISYMLYTSRKSATRYIGTCQSFMSIDLRWRQMTDYIVMCKNHGEPSEFLRDGRKNPRYDPDGWFDYKILKQSSDAPRLKNFRITFKDAYSIFALYDTYERFPINPDIRGGAIQDKCKLLERLEPIIDAMLEQSPPAKWSRSAVEGHCTKNRLPKQYASVIYNEMRLRAMGCGVPPGTP